MSPPAAFAGYAFRDPELLREALTHRSVTGSKGGAADGRRSNERLEFIGDRVLGLVMAEWLFERFPDEPQGLSPRHAHLVSGVTLAKIALATELPALLDVAPHEVKAGVLTQRGVLADAVEAMIGALYQDGGLEPPRRFIREAWRDEFEDQVDLPVEPKTALQEWAMARRMKLPVYEVTRQEGPSHAPRFNVSVSLGRHGASAEGGTKREAERLAAVDLLRKLRA